MRENDYQTVVKQLKEMAGGDPNDPGFKVRDIQAAPGVDAERLGNRRELLRIVDKMRRDVDASGEVALLLQVTVVHDAVPPSVVSPIGEATRDLIAAPEAATSTTPRR